jgi:HPt (histidine-containing phosphotransfer) domain-containing protein
MYYIPVLIAWSLMDSDLINLDELKSLYGEDSVRELLEMSLNEARELIARLKISVPARNAASVSADAHQLKGMSATMTIKRMSEFSYKLEQCGKTKNWDDSDSLLASIVSTFTELEQYLLKELALS